jgi:molybdopterin-guanine dinucleotide biosynthesis protein A
MSRRPLSAIILCDRYDAEEFAAASLADDPAGRAAINRLTALLALEFAELILVGTRPLSLMAWDGLIVAPRGPSPTLLHGLQAGLAAARNPMALVVKAEMTELQPAVVDLLATAAEPRWEAVVPHPQGRPAPFPALYARSILPRIAVHLEKGIYSVATLAAKLRLRPLSDQKLRRADAALISFGKGAPTR